MSVIQDKERVKVNKRKAQRWIATTTGRIQCLLGKHQPVPGRTKMKRKNGIIVLKYKDIKCARCGMGFRPVTQWRRL